MYGEGEVQANAKFLILCCPFSVGRKFEIIKMGKKMENLFLVGIFGSYVCFEQEF